MRTIALVGLLLSPLAAFSQDVAGRSAIFLFGPSGAENARQAARVAASVSRRWLSEAGSTAELRRTGSLDGLTLEAKVSAKAIEPSFLNAAREARDTDRDALLAGLEHAAQALAGRPGLRLLIAIAEQPPLSTDAEAQLKQTIDFCKSNSIRVVVLDPAQTKNSSGSLKALAESTGGALIRDLKALEGAVLISSAGSHTGETVYVAPAVVQPLAESNLPKLATDLPVETRFVRTSSKSTQSFGMSAQGVSAGRGGITSSDNLNLDTMNGPMRGLLFVESPLSALQFDVDDNAGMYTAKARVTQIVRNASGKVVWRASKPLILHGPVKKLAERRSGNLDYMREIDLPAGQYTLEAVVEDLLAGKSGGVRKPLATGAGTPGFTVSDALLVRPFNGAVDKFEADQVLNYDGNAISPLLSPTFQASEPFNLQIYLVLYPDLYGAQPQLSLEILRNGHVVGRSALPFTDKIRNSATESSGMSSVVGEQKHEFPYLATLRGVQFSPGDYEARVTIRQGNSALTRPVSFRVLGSERTAVLASAGPNAAAAAPASDDDAEVTLPEVDPVHLDTTAAQLPAPEQQKLWDEATASALSYASHLPNFRCNRETRRLIAPVKSADRLKEADSFIEELTYESPHESYRTLEVNGQKSSMTRDLLKGVSSKGEFGTMLKSVFRKEAAAKYRWAGRAMTGGVLCEVFDVDIPVNRSNFIFTFNLRQEIAGFRGRVFVDEETGLVRRIVLDGNGLPKDFGLQSPTFSLEYGMVRIAGEDYLLPLHSVLQVRQGKQVVRNETQFRDYRKFEAASEIKF